MARDLHPGKRNTLDALCERYGISNAHRRLHGALLDAELLAEVYLAMTRGQDSLEIGLRLASEGGQGAVDDAAWPPRQLVVVQAGEREIGEHEALLERIARDAGKPDLWRGAGGLE